MPAHILQAAEAHPGVRADRHEQIDDHACFVSSDGRSGVPLTVDL